MFLAEKCGHIQIYVHLNVICEVGISEFDSATRQRFNFQDLRQFYSLDYCRWSRFPSSWPTGLKSILMI